MNSITTNSGTATRAALTAWSSTSAGTRAYTRGRVHTGLMSLTKQESVSCPATNAAVVAIDLPCLATPREATV